MSSYRIMKRFGFMLAGWLIFVAVSFASARLDDIQRRMVSLNNSYYTEATWMELMDDLDRIRSDAEERKDVDEAIAAGLLQAHAYVDLRDEQGRALALLERLKVEYGNSGSAELRKAYLMQAGLYAERGDPLGISRLIYEFQKSPGYDGAPFQYSGGESRGQPLKIVRPNARGSASITVTTMEQLRQQAQTGKDRPLESILVLDERGREYDLARLPWKVTLIDFWLGAWVPWRGNISYMVDAYTEYQDMGFGILGISLNDDPTAGLALLKAEHAKWPQVKGQGRAVAREFGYYGEASNVLVDERGFVLARNIRGADLGALVRKALNIPEGSWDHE